LASRAARGVLAAAASDKLQVSLADDDERAEPLRQPWVGVHFFFLFDAPLLGRRPNPSAGYF